MAVSPEVLQGLRPIVAAVRADELDVWGLMPRLLRYPRLFPDNGRPCPRGCAQCFRCKMAWHAQWRDMFALPDTETYILSRRQEPVGLVYFTDIVPGVEAQLHGQMFDGRLFDKTDAIRDVLADRTERRIYATLPEYAHPLAKYLIRSHGFREAGGAYEPVRWNGRWWPVTVVERAS